MKKCANCEKEFSVDTVGRKSPIKKFCTNACRNQYNENRFRSLNTQLNLSSNVVGSMNELRVCIDLLKRGYEVFRNVCSSGMDLAILKEGKLIKIEVVTGYYSCSGDLYNPKKNRIKKWDCLAIVITDGDIIYEPEI